MASTILFVHFDGQNATSPALKWDSSCGDQLLLISTTVINSLRWSQWYQWFGTKAHGRRAKFLVPETCAENLSHVTWVFGSSLPKRASSHFCSIAACASCTGFWHKKQRHRQNKIGANVINHSVACPLFGWLFWPSLNRLTVVVEVTTIIK